MPSFKYILGEQAQIPDQNANAVKEFGQYDFDLEFIASGKHVPHDIKISHVSASKPSPKGNIIMIKNALEFARTCNDKGSSSYHFTVLNRWLDFLEYVHFIQDRLVIKVFDFQCMFPADNKNGADKKLSDFRSKLTNIGFDNNDLFLLLYEKSGDGNKMKLIGGGHRDILLFPVPELFFEKAAREVGDNSSGNKSTVFSIDQSVLRPFEERGKDFVSWFKRYVGNVEMRHWWDNLIDRVHTMRMEDLVQDNISVLDVINDYYCVLGSNDDDKKDRFIANSINNLGKFNSLSSLYEDTQIFRDRIIQEDPELSNGLMKITIPEGGENCEIQLNSNDIDVLKTVNSDEFFLYPYKDSLVGSQVHLLRIDNNKQQKYFLLRGNKFRIYEGASVVNLSPFFFNYFPRTPQNRMWVMLCNTPEKNKRILGNFRLDTTLGFSTNISEVKDIDYKLYHFNENIPSSFTFVLDRDNEPSITGTIRLLPKNKEVPSGNARVAIDLGTSNTYLTYQVDGLHTTPQEVEFAPKLCAGLIYSINMADKAEMGLYQNYLNTINTPESYDKDNFIELYRSFFPLHLGGGTTHKFPTYTALRVIDTTSNEKLSALTRYRFGFHFVNEIGSDNQKLYETEIKWRDNGRLYLITVDVLMAFTEAYLFQKYNIPCESISWTITQPQSLLKLANYHPVETRGKGISFVDEAIAPLNFINRGENHISAETIVINTDIGGGTIDIGIAHRATREKIHYYKTSCHYGFNNLIEKSPVYDDSEIKTIWPSLDKGSIVDNTNLNDLNSVLNTKRLFSKSGLPANLTNKQSINLLLYYSSILWHVSNFVDILIKQNSNQIINYSEGIYIQFTGQGSNFIRKLMRNIGVGREVTNTPFREFTDSKDLYDFHKLFFGRFGSKINLRLSAEGDSKKVTGMGALLGAESLGGDVSAMILMANDKIGELNNKDTFLDDTIRDTVTTDFSNFLKLIDSTEFRIGANNLFGFTFGIEELKRIQELGIESITTIDRALRIGGGNAKIAPSVGAKVEIRECPLSSSPLLWPFYGIFQRF